jgi:Tfp pilus assembly protein PilO
MNTNKAFMGAGLIAIAAFLFWMLDLGTYNHMSSLKAAIAERQKIFDERKAIVDNVAKLNKEYVERGGEIKQFSSVIPTKKEIAELVSAFEAISTRSGLNLTEITTSESNEVKAEYASLFIVMKARGGYAALTNFLDGVEKNIRLVDVDSIELAPTDNQVGVLDMTIKAFVYSTK